MSKLRLILIALTICAVAVPLTAGEEEAPPMSVAKSHFVMVNPGQALAFEAAYKDQPDKVQKIRDTEYEGDC